MWSFQGQTVVYSRWSERSLPQLKNGMQQDDIARLIAMAAEEAGSKSEVARRIAVSPQRLRDYEAGTRPCTPEKVALIADVAKLPADQWLARAVLWRHEGKPDEPALKKALGKCLRVTGAALA